MCEGIVVEWFRSKDPVVFLEPKVSRIMMRAVLQFLHFFMIEFS